MKRIHLETGEIITLKLFGYHDGVYRTDQGNFTWDEVQEDEDLDGLLPHRVLGILCGVGGDVNHPVISILWDDAGEARGFEIML